MTAKGKMSFRSIVVILPGLESSETIDIEEKILRKQYLIFIFALVLVLAACGPASTETPEAEEPVDTELDPTVEVTDGVAAPEGMPESFEGLDFETTESGLQIAITEEGSGEQAEIGKVVAVHYTGMLGDGQVFDSSMTQGEPIRFPLGQGRVIPGWEEGIAMLSEGAKAKLIIPGDLGYGAQGAGGGVIPPNATLYFDVELIDVSEGGPAAPEDIDTGDYEETESGLMYYELEAGDGAMAEEGDPVSIHFTAWLEDGTRIDSTLDGGTPFTFELGSEQVFEGWNEAVSLMEVGDSWQVVIPSELALGAEGAGDVIPPDSNLVMRIDFLEILPAGPSEPTEVDEDEYTTTESGLKYVDLEEGEGEPIAEGDAIAVHYTGWLEDGTRFDSSYGRGTPLGLMVGAGQVIPGWDEGLVGMRPGGKRQLVIPAELGYGEQGAGDVIPPGATLIFEIEIPESMPVSR